MQVQLEVNIVDDDHEEQKKTISPLSLVPTNRSDASKDIQGPMIDGFIQRSVDLTHQSQVVATNLTLELIIQFAFGGQVGKVLKTTPFT